MNEKIYRVLADKGIALKNPQRPELDKFTKKKTLDALTGVDMKGFYTLLFFRSAKARFLSKEFEAIDEIAGNIAEQTGVNFKKKAIFYSSDICSKTANLMKENGYKHDFM